MFLWAKNQTNAPTCTSDSFKIVDTNGRHVPPDPDDAELNGYAWTQQVLAPTAVEPEPNTTASFGPTQGGLILFKLRPRSTRTGR